MSQKKKIRRRNDQQELKPTLRDIFAIKQNIPQRMLSMVKIRVTGWAEEGKLAMSTEDVTEILIHPNDWAKVVKEANAYLSIKRKEDDEDPATIYGIPVVKGDS